MYFYSARDQRLTVKISSPPKAGSGDIPQMIHLLIPGLIFSLFHYARAQQTFYPAAIPLFVRSPYLNCWGYLSNEPSSPKISQTTTFSHVQQPRSGWDPSLDVNLVVLVRVDNSTYLFLGNASTVNTTVNLTNVTVSPTQTKLTAEAGPMQINLTFLNPIEREDWVKQSIPFSYMSLTAESLDGTAHAVQVYSDLNLGIAQLDSVATSAAGVLVNGGHFNFAISPQPEWGTLYYGMQSGVRNDITTNISDVPASRDLFRLNGVLGTLDQLYNTTPNYQDSTVFAISRDLGTIQATQAPVISAIGYDVNLVMNYTDLSGATQKRKLLYQDKYGGKGDILADFISDFANASSRAQGLDLKILQQASPISGPLGDLVSLATAQVYGSFLLTVALDANGNFDNLDVMAFMRNMGGSKTNRVNAVETLYSAFPAFMYIDPGLGGLFLEPLFQLQASQIYTNLYAAADIGTNYPDVTLTNSAHSQGVEHSGNMLIMTYAHARASGDFSLISRYYDTVLVSWADYLSDATLLVHTQSSADGLSADNQTNLAIKGIIAIEAMSKMSSIIKRNADIDKYSSTAASLYAQWKSLALTSDKHLLAIYDQVGSWTLGYNLFADVWLNTNVVESPVYDGQSTFINNLSSTSNFSNSGMPVDNLGTDADNPGPVSNWSMFAAAMMSNHDQRTNLISRVHNRESTYPLTPFGQGNLNPTILGGGPSPAQGAMYAPLALQAPVLTTDPTTTGTSSKPHTGLSVVIKGVVGGVAALLVIGAIALVVWRRRRRGYRRTSAEPLFPSDVVSEVTVTPFDSTGPVTTAMELHLAGPQTGSQQLLLHRPSSPDGSPLPLQRALPIPVGLSDKELARLRSLENGPRSQPTEGQPSNPPLTVTADRGELGGVAGVATSSFEAQRLQMENSFLRHEIEQLRVERSEFPPSYASDTGLAS
ncbi:hypothetical protein EDB86DRAFT_3107620 [Lactarius hatsudake]|nr:hypothetical protein EDB86DRAFT_3107620 [Lactarius hatsudake]